MRDETRPLKSVYSYLFPEVRKVIESVEPAELNRVLLRSVDPGLDDFHRPFLEEYYQYLAKQLVGLHEYPEAYITGGASEAIFHLLAREKSRNPKIKLYTLNGEYEGYAGYARNLEINCITVGSIENLAQQSPGVLFVSNPSAKDGNSLSRSEWEKILDSGHRIFYDATYVGLTDKLKINVSHPAIEVVVASMSKPFGLYYLRVGAIYSRHPLPTLEVNKWFKNIHSIMVARKVLSNVNSEELVQRCRTSQQRAVARLNQNFGLETKPSEVVLLANMRKAEPLANACQMNLDKYARGDGYRFCLTPYYLEEEENDRKS